MIEPGVVACHAYGDTVNATRFTKPFLWIFRIDDAPPLSNIVTTEHIKNRPHISHGKIVSWGRHGHVAILENQEGKRAAFNFYEINR